MVQKKRKIQNKKFGKKLKDGMGIFSFTHSKILIKSPYFMFLMLT